MKALLVVSVLVGLSSATKGQLTYEKFYTTGVSYKFNCTELTSKNLFVGLGCAHGISRVDQEGNVIQTRCYVPNPMARITSCRRKADDRFMFATSYQLDTCGASGSFTVPYTHPAIGIMDTTGNILAYKHYVLGEGCRNAAGDLVVTADNGAVVWGSDTSFFILKVDSNLAPVWSRRFGDPGGIQFVKELPGGDLLVGANMGSIGAVVARLDADGNVLWSKSYIRPTSMVHDAVIEADDSFIVTGVTESTTSLFTVPLAPEYHPKLFMMKLDGAGAVQWCRGYENAPERWYAAQPSRIERTLDGNYVMLATSGVHDNGLNYNHFSRLHLMKTDGALLFGQETDNTITDPTGYSSNPISTTEGAFPKVRTEGNTLEYPRGAFSIADFNEASQYCVNEKTGNAMMVWHGHKLGIELEDLLINYTSDTNINYVVGETNGKKMLEFGFHSIKKAGITWVFRELDLLNNPEQFGVTGFEDKQHQAIVFPIAMERMYANVERSSSRMAPLFGMRYKALGPYNRRMQVWEVGGTGHTPAARMITEYDTTNLYSRSHIGFQGMCFNKWQIWEGVAA